MSEEGFMEEGRVRNVLADRGVLILLASRYVRSTTHPILRDWRIVCLWRLTS